YLYNGHGDVVQLVDAAQNLVDQYSYDEFGKTFGVQKVPNHRRYVGSLDVYSDDDIGLQYMWNRWYDPVIGRFISRDPKGIVGGDLNLYVYAGNNPIFGMDPSGLMTQEDWRHYLYDLSFTQEFGDPTFYKATATIVLASEGVAAGWWAIWGEGGLAAITADISISSNAWFQGWGAAAGIDELLAGVQWHIGHLFKQAFAIF